MSSFPLIASQRVQGGESQAFEKYICDCRDTLFTGCHLLCLPSQRFTQICQIIVTSDDCYLSQLLEEGRGGKYMAIFT